jgi:AraC-like DNA-binding protein
MAAINDLDLGENIIAAQGEGGCTIYQISNKTGEGIMTMYEVFPGVYLMYNDFHLSNGVSEFQNSSDMLAIDHCREGQIEQVSGKQAYTFFSAGDLYIDNRKQSNTHYVLPLDHYHGITIAFLLDIAPSVLRENFKDFPISLHKLKEKYCQNNFYVLRNQPFIEHLYSELYHVPEQIKLTYFKIKIYELLLFLDALTLPEEPAVQPYFYKTQVEKIKAIQSLITEDLQNHYTQEALSKRFNIGLTSMKTCFKCVYGMSIYSYMRAYRINQAAVLLRKTERNIVDIALQVGYNSPSKFSAAFKNVMKKTPMDYRKSFV